MGMCSMPSKSEKRMMESLGYVQFAFYPKQWVTVTMHGLDYPARVIRCIQEHGDKFYDCDIWTNGEPRRREFYEDEIKARGENK